MILAKNTITTKVIDLGWEFLVFANNIHFFQLPIIGVIHSCRAFKGASFGCSEDYFQTMTNEFDSRYTPTYFKILKNSTSFVMHTVLKSF